MATSRKKNDSRAGEKKIYKTVLTALENTPREQWSYSPAVSHALLECPRVKGIVRAMMRKKGVKIDLLSETISEVAFKMQSKVLATLIKVDDGVYSLLAATADYICSNDGRKLSTSNRSPEVSLSDYANDDESSDDVIQRLGGEDSTYDNTGSIHDALDRKTAQNRFKEKLAKIGWPETIARDRARKGRPLQENPIIRH